MKSKIENRKPVVSKVEPSKINVVFMGTPGIAAIILESLFTAFREDKQLLDQGFEIKAVFTRPDKPRGRNKKLAKSEVKLLSEIKNLPVRQPKNKDELAKEAAKLKPDLIVVAAYGMILPKEVLDVPKYGAINVHPSLLPLYRGPAPISAPILNGDKKTGVTIIKMDARMDEGDILAQEEVELSGHETTPELTERLAELAGKILADAIPRYVNGEINSQKQDRTKATYTKMIKKEDGKIDFASETAEEIERKSRAFLPWPGVYMYWNDKKLDFYEIGVISQRSDSAKRTDLKDTPRSVLGRNQKPGLVQKSDNGFAIGTKKGAITSKYVKLEGKNKIPASDFLHGYPDFIESKLN